MIRKLQMILAFEMFLSFGFLLCFGCTNQDKKTSPGSLTSDNQVEKMGLIIRNMTSEPIFLRDRHEIHVSVGFFENEKIYYCSEPIYFINISNDGRREFVNILNPNEKNEISIKKVDIDNTKYHYEIEDNGYSARKIYDGQCDKISFRLFYTKEPISTFIYSDYVDNMKLYGYYAVGYQEDDKIIFDILNHSRISGGM